MTQTQIFAQGALIAASVVSWFAVLVEWTVLT
jgi:hypothetical protein